MNFLPQLMIALAGTLAVLSPVQAQDSGSAKKSAASTKKAAAAKKQAAIHEDDKEPDIQGTVAINYDCELGNKLTIYRNVDDNEHLAMRWQKRLLRLKRVETTTGANRFENARNGWVWIDIPAKGMLLDAKRGRQLANECMSPEQAMIRASANGTSPSSGLLQPPPAVLDPGPAAVTSTMPPTASPTASPTVPQTSEGVPPSPTGTLPAVPPAPDATNPVPVTSQN